MVSKRVMRGKIYHRPYYSSSAVDNLKLYANSRTIGKSDYLRLSSLSLRYRLPYKWIEKTKNVIQYASVAFQASNLLPGLIIRSRTRNPVR